MMKRCMQGLMGAVVALSGMVPGGIALADGFRNPPPTAEGLGIVGARYTMIDDASAAAYNPANLMGVQKSDLLLSLTMVRSEKDFTSPLGAKDSVKEEWALLPDLFYALPLEGGRAVAGIAVTTPYGQSSELDRDGYFSQFSPYFAEMRTVNLNPTVAYRLNDQLDVAVGLDVMWSDLELRQVFPWSMLTLDPASPNGTARFEGDGIGVGGNAGITWRPAAGHRVALVYRSAIDVDYEGDFTIDNVPGAGTPAAVARSRTDFESTIKFPNVVALGYGVDLSDRLSVGAEVEWFQWSRYDQQTLDIAENAPLLGGRDTITTDWDDALNFGAGAAYRLDDQWTARASYIFLASPIPDETMLPVLAENDQHVISVGLGYASGAHRLDLAYGIGIYDDRDIDNNQQPALNGKYEFSSHLLAVSYGVQL
jgi:long-chain fatty acid transport protein